MIVQIITVQFIQVTIPEIYQRSVSYSMSENITEFVPFTTNHGKIKSIDYANDHNVKKLS